MEDEERAVKLKATDFGIANLQREYRLMFLDVEPLDAKLSVWIEVSSVPEARPESVFMRADRNARANGFEWRALVWRQTVFCFLVGAELALSHKKGSGAFTGRLDQMRVLEAKFGSVKVHVKFDIVVSIEKEECSIRDAMC